VEQEEEEEEMVELLLQLLVELVDLELLVLLWGVLGLQRGRMVQELQLQVHKEVHTWTLLLEVSRLPQKRKRYNRSKLDGEKKNSANDKLNEMGGHTASTKRTKRGENVNEMTTEVQARRERHKS
jgi:hypothetical protein